MEERECTKTRELLEAYALGALDAEERTQVESHLGTCARCRRLADELLEVAHALPGALAAASDVRVPPSLKSQLLRVLPGRSKVTSAARVPGLTSGRRRWLRPGIVGSLVAAAVALVSLGWNAHLSSALSQERSLRARLAQIVGSQELVLEVVDSKKTQRAFLAPPAGTASRAYGKLFTRPDSPYVVAMAARLPQAPEGQGYRLSLTQHGRVEPAGDLTLTKQGFALLVFRSNRPGPAYDAARVVLQPKGEAEGKTVLVWRRS